MSKCVEAVERGDDKVEVWGTGTASREYLYVDDAAEAIAIAATTPIEPGTIPQPVNLGTDHEVTIRETVETIARLTGFTGELRWDPTKPDGQPRRRVDASVPSTSSAGAPGPRSRTACGRPSTGTSPTARKPSGPALTSRHVGVASRYSGAMLASLSSLWRRSS